MQENKINVSDVQEVIQLISKLDDEKKKIALAALRGAVLVSEAAPQCEAV